MSSRNSFSCVFIFVKLLLMSTFAALKRSFFLSTDLKSGHWPFYSLGCVSASVTRPFTTAGRSRHNINVSHIWCIILVMGVQCQTYEWITYLWVPHSSLLCCPLIIFPQNGHINLLAVVSTCCPAGRCRQPFTIFHSKRTLCDYAERDLEHPPPSWISFLTLFFMI